MSTAHAADRADKYDRLLGLADLFDEAGNDLRTRARLGDAILHDDAVAESAELCPATYGQAESDVRSATIGTHGLLTRGIELDADALIVRATVLTYRWIDELQEAAYQTLGTIAGRAIGYLAPEVALGGAIVSAGLIETDALDRDDVAAYLSELAANNPDLMEHVTSGGGGLLDGLEMRSLLTAGLLSGESRRQAAQGGLRALGVGGREVGFGAALRDIAGPVVEATPAELAVDTGAADDTVPSSAPRNLEELMRTLETAGEGVHVHQVTAGRYIAYLHGPAGGDSERRLRLVSGERTTDAARVVAAIEAAVAGDDHARVMLVGLAQGGVTAAEVAKRATSGAFVIEQVVTAGAPSAQVPTLPAPTRMLSFEDRRDPVALLGSLINAGADNRMTVVFDGGTAEGGEIYVAGGRAADEAQHPGLRAEIQRLRAAGYLSG